MAAATKDLKILVCSKSSQAEIGTSATIIFKYESCSSLIGN